MKEERSKHIRIIYENRVKLKLMCEKNKTTSLVYNFYITLIVSIHAFRSVSSYPCIKYTHSLICWATICWAHQKKNEYFSFTISFTFPFILFFFHTRLLLLRLLLFLAKSSICGFILFFHRNCFGKLLL